MRRIIFGIGALLTVSSLFYIFSSEKQEPPKLTAVVVCPDVSAYQTRSCLVTTEWSNRIKIGDGPASNGMQLCISPGVQFERSDESGTTYWRFKVSTGKSVHEYRLFSANAPCPQTMPR